MKTLDSQVFLVLKTSNGKGASINIIGSLKS